MALATLDARQLRNLDATAATAGLGPEVLMERAGMALASFLLEFAAPTDSVLFVCGSGGNAGDGFVAARHLCVAGRRVSVVFTQEPAAGPVRANKGLLEHMGVPLLPFEKGFSLSPYDVLVDCVLGYGQKGAPSGVAADAVRLVARSGKRVVACDLPSGVDAGSGELFEPHVVAHSTVSFAAPRKGFERAEALGACGRVLVVGIGIPGFIYQQLGLAEGSYLVEGRVQWPGGEQKGF